MTAVRQDVGRQDPNRPRFVPQFGHEIVARPMGSDASILLVRDYYITNKCLDTRRYLSCATYTHGAHRGSIRAPHAGQENEGAQGKGELIWP